MIMTMKEPNWINTALTSDPETYSLFEQDNTDNSSNKDNTDNLNNKEKDTLSNLEKESLTMWRDKVQLQVTN